MNIVFLFYEGMTALDAIGPHEILCRPPGIQVKRVAKSSGEILTDSGLILTAEYKLADVVDADILLIPGAGKAASLKDFPDILEWVRKIHSSTTWTTSVCTGSLILGAAGVLSGIKATTHWAALDRLPQYGAQPTHSRIVESGKIITAAGVSAGIDMALALVEKIFDRRLAEALQLGIEYDPEPPFNSGSPEKADPELVKMMRERMVAKFENPY
ncbi:DJ-1/PfpI family protein [Candidiatus Paracoxiella cheracis]|uniref:DJ-1/PfpI family protein n=1 Tax=Candidiatus Paracoxiella cheracis TaxID=3405120 RepID=UPI003BF5A55D